MLLFTAVAVAFLHHSALSFPASLEYDDLPVIGFSSGDSFVLAPSDTEAEDGQDSLDLSDDSLSAVSDGVRDDTLTDSDDYDLSADFPAVSEAMPPSTSEAPLKATMPPTDNPQVPSGLTSAAPSEAEAFSENHPESASPGSTLQSTTYDSQTTQGPPIPQPTGFTDGDEIESSILIVRGVSLRCSSIYSPASCYLVFAQDTESIRPDSESAINDVGTSQDSSDCGANEGKPVDSQVPAALAVADYSSPMPESVFTDEQRRFLIFASGVFAVANVVLAMAVLGLVVILGRFSSHPNH